MARIVIQPRLAITAAGTAVSDNSAGFGSVGDIDLEANFDYGSGGTSVDAYVQTSLDGINFFDIAHFSFTTADAIKNLSVSSSGDVSTPPTRNDAALAADTVQTGIIGDQLRVKVVSVGTYVASYLKIFAIPREDGGGPSTVNLSSSSLTALENVGLNAGETHIGEVGGYTSVVKPTWTVDTAIYAALDCLGAAAATSVITLTNAMRISGGRGVLESVSLFDDDNEKAAISLLFFDAAPASGTYTGNGALSMSTGDKAKYIGKVNIAVADYETLGGEAFASIKGIGLGVGASGSANLYMIPLVTVGTPTYTAATDLQVVLTFLCD